MTVLSDDQIERYSRQLLLGGWGSREQASLLRAHVALSAGEEAAALYLAGAGVGTLTLLDAADEKIAATLRSLNPDVEIHFARTGAHLPQGVFVLEADSALSAQTLAAARLIKRIVTASPGRPA